MDNQNWSVTFDYHENNIDCSVRMTGNAKALAVGLAMAVATVRTQFEGLIMNGKGSVDLINDLSVLASIPTGDIAPHQGTYLTVKKLRTKASGLVTSIEITW